MGSLSVKNAQDPSKRPATPDIFKPFSVSVVSLGIGPQTVWTPTNNRRFRIMGFSITSDKAAQVNFKDGTVASFWATPALVANTPFGILDLGDGYLSASANNLLRLDVSTGVPVALTGMVWGREE